MSTYHQNQNAAEHGGLLARCEAAEAERDRLAAAAEEMLAALRVLGPIPETIEGQIALLNEGFAHIDSAAARLQLALAPSRRAKESG